MTRRTIAVVPFRAPGVGKTRLAGLLTPTRRAVLSTAMLADVVAALRAARVDEILVAAGGPGAVAAATRLGVPAVADPPHAADLDAVLAAITAGLDVAADVLILAADLPRSTAGDLRSVLDGDGDVVLAPTRDAGTAALLRRAGHRIPTAYGPSSAVRHRQLAVLHGAAYAEVRAPGLLDDVDTVGDVHALAAAPVGPATAGALDTLTLPG